MHILPYRILHGYGCPSLNKIHVLFSCRSIFIFVQKLFSSIFKPKSTKKTGFFSRLFHGFTCNRSSSGLSFFVWFLFKQNSDPIKFTAFIWLSIHRRNHSIQNVPNIVYELHFMLKIYAIIKPT